ncbi:hypothetical protein M9Y10_041053 [Tritrichomonas musculus]|uniref:Transmembrane protein n=1 Tax=Tritrichomonas musculus TaxID=1915356 RepID=A0ABR2K494_9EUKA
MNDENQEKLLEDFIEFDRLLEQQSNENPASSLNMQPENSNLSKPNDFTKTAQISQDQTNINDDDNSKNQSSKEEVETNKCQNTNNLYKNQIDSKSNSLTQFIDKYLVSIIFIFFVFLIKIYLFN